MWNTADGPRKLQPRERSLFLHGALALRDFLHDVHEGNDHFDVGVSVFDRIPAVDRPHVLLWVAEHVLGDGPPPPIRGWSAGTIAAVFAYVETMMELEIEDFKLEGGISLIPWRRRIHEAWMERCLPNTEVRFPKGEGVHQPLDSQNLEEWRFKIGGLTEEILADADYEVDEILDVSPERATATKEYLGIENDYYTEPAPTFSSEDRQRLAKLRTLLGSEADRT